MENNPSFYSYINSIEPKKLYDFAKSVGENKRLILYTCNKKQQISHRSLDFTLQYLQKEKTL